MNSNSYFKLVFLFFPLLLFTGCQSDDDSSPKTAYGIFKIIDDNTIEMDGVINSSTLGDFNKMISDYPDLNRINMNEVPGSEDDQTNLRVSKKVNDRNMATHIMDNGYVASGGTDFFLAGQTRTMGAGSQIGVHSWSDGTNEATDFPVGHEFHQPYIDYYISIGFTQEESESFYYFTINAASADDIHWMTEDEIQEYKMLKP